MTHKLVYLYIFEADIQQFFVYVHFNSKSNAFAVYENLKQKATTTHMLAEKKLERKNKHSVASRDMC